MKYFRRVYQGPSPLDEVMIVRTSPDGTTVITVGPPDQPIHGPVEQLAPEGLVIYGHAIRPTRGSEDDRAVRLEAERGLLYCRCFSVIVPDGELGFQPLATLTEISGAEFKQAKLRGWT